MAFETPRLFADVFVPQIGVGCDELGHHLNAFWVFEVDDFDSLGAEEIGGAGEVVAFADDDFGDSELHGRAAAEIAGHEGGIEDGVAIGLLSAGVHEAIDFRVGHGVAVLDASVAAAADDVVAAHQHGTDGEAAFL